ncbi:MAG: hypothetical protein ACC645_07920 [Pirellulales bacterium]
MTVTFQRLTILLALIVAASLFAGSSVRTARAQCCGGPRYYKVPRRRPVNERHAASVAPNWERSTCGGPIDVPRGAPPQVMGRPAPGNGVTVPHADHGSVPGKNQPAVAPKPPLPPPIHTRETKPAKPHVHGAAEAEAPAPPIPSGPVPTDTRTLAEKQRVCPVTEQPLGSMGKPYQVRAKGRDVLLCCKGCVAKFKSDPDKYLAKLNP